MMQCANWKITAKYTRGRRRPERVLLIPAESKERAISLARLFLREEGEGLMAITDVKEVLQ